MIMRFSCATFLALTSVSTHAFLAPGEIPRLTTSAVEMVGSWDNDGFLEALSGGNRQPEDDDEPRDGDQGGSRLKEIMAKAQQAASSTPERGFRPIENPFLTPRTPPTTTTNFEEMSVEEQARRFREMMQNGGEAAEAPRSSRTARTDRAGRPVGRNRDADTIANAADLYFAQLKRDSSVRGIARIRGDAEKADQVFADKGIKELEGLMYENPYLKGQRDKEKIFFDTVPEEFIRPYFDPDALPEEERTTSGISYRELMKRRGQKKADGGPQVQNQGPPQPLASQTIQQPTSLAPPQIPQTIQQPSNMAPPQAPQPYQQQSNMPIPQVPQSYQQPTVMAPPQPAVPQSVPTSADESKRKMRTLMGMLLKHRGGPGFGKGRLTGGEIDQFSNLLQDVLGMLREESFSTSTVPPPTLPQVSMTPVQPQVSMTPVQSLSAYPQSAVAVPAVPSNPSQVDSMIACVDGAIKMYKNCPPELQVSVLSTLRAALFSAVSTCDRVIGFPDPNPAPVMSQVEGTIAVIEGAMMMYKNSPPELQPSLLGTLRTAFRAAVSTYDSMLGGGFPQPSMPAAPAAPIAAAPQLVAPPAVPQQVIPQAVAPTAVPIIPATDPNSKVLEDIYNTMQSAAGDGSLGLRSDLTSEDASELADSLVKMRKVLMEELDAGIPDPEPVSSTAQTTPERAPADSSTVSKYQQMLAKAKAEKTGGMS